MSNTVLLIFFKLRGIKMLKSLHHSHNKQYYSYGVIKIKTPYIQKFKTYKSVNRQKRKRK